jgi:hypothetical protein
LRPVSDPSCPPSCLGRLTKHVWLGARPCHHLSHFIAGQRDCRFEVATLHSLQLKHCSVTIPVQRAQNGQSRPRAPVEVRRQASRKRIACEAASANGVVDGAFASFFRGEDAKKDHSRREVERTDARRFPVHWTTTKQRTARHGGHRKQARVLSGRLTEGGAQLNLGQFEPTFLGSRQLIARG